MKKRTLQWCGGIFLSVLLSQAYSQTFFMNPDPNITNPTSTYNVQPSPVISPSDYKNIVSTMHKQTAATLKNEYQQSTDMNPNGSAPTYSNTVPVPTTPVPPPPTAPSTMPSFGTAPATVPPNTNPQGIPLPNAPPPQKNTNSPYTGFGTGNTNNQNPAPSNQNSGWGIKY